MLSGVRLRWMGRERRRRRADRTGESPPSGVGASQRLDAGMSPSDARRSGQRTRNSRSFCTIHSFTCSHVTAVLHSCLMLGCSGLDGVDRCRRTNAWHCSFVSNVGTLAHVPSSSSSSP